MRSDSRIKETERLFTAICIEPPDQFDGSLSRCSRNINGNTRFCVFPAVGKLEQSFHASILEHVVEKGKQQVFCKGMAVSLHESAGEVQDSC